MNNIDQYVPHLSIKRNKEFDLPFICRLCGNARFVVKVDDDIRLDLAMLETLLHSKYGSPGSKRPVPDTIECPSVMRNMRPWRQTHNKVR